MTSSRAASSHRSGEREHAALRRFAASHDLTQAEEEVLNLLLQGFRPAEIGATRGVAISTVRTQLKRLFAKTGTRGQTDLIRKVLQES